MKKAKKTRNKKPDIIEGDKPQSLTDMKVWFFDDYHGFWRTGYCSKEVKGVSHVRCDGSIYKVFSSSGNIVLTDTDVEPWNKPKDLEVQPVVSE